MNAAALLVLSDTLSAHISRALVEHLRWCRRNGVAEPPELAALLAALSGQERPNLATQGERADPDAVLLGYAAAGARLGISARTVRRRVAEGRIPVVRDGRRRLIRVSDLDAYGSVEE